MKNIVLMMAIGFGLALLAPKVSGQLDSGQPAEQNAPEAEGLEAWSKIYQLVSHPRCANCHVADGTPMWSGPHYGKTIPHAMYVGGDPELLLGNPGMMCTTCHMAENSAKLHGPPGNEVWHLPPKEMVWWNKSSAEICAQLKDPARNGDRTLEEIAEHIANDSLVAWGWAPGPGRQPAPFSAQEAANFVTSWSAQGAPCPQ